MSTAVAGSMGTGTANSYFICKWWKYGGPLIPNVGTSTEEYDGIFVGQDGPALNTARAMLEEQFWNSNRH